VQASGIWGAARAWCRRARFIIGAALVAAVAGATYSRVPGFGFIYDDYWTVVGNTYLDRPFRELVAAAISGRSVEWNMPDATRPWMGLSLWLDRRLFGLSPGGYHLHSLGLYALVCVLVFLLAFGVLRRFMPAVYAGLVFAALPIHVEVATAINYREDLIAAAGVLGAAALWFWPGRRGLRWRSLACGLAWAYGLLGKESALIAPLMVAALSIARRRRLASSEAIAPPGLVVGIVAALWLNWRFGVSRLGEQIPTASYTGAERVLRTFRFEVLAFAKSLAPFSPRPERDPLGSAHLAWAIVLALIVAGVVWLARRRRTRVLAAAGAAALVAPLCASPLLAPLNEIADRYWFVGSLAAALVVGWATSQPWARRAELAVAVLVAGCSVASWKASSVWSSEVDLWSFIVQTSSSSPRAWSQIARVHRLADQDDLAQRAVERSLALRPDYSTARFARVFNDLWFGRLDAARAEFRLLEGREGLRADTLRLARRCVTAVDTAAARDCLERSTPRGMVLGDVQRLRAVSERLLAEPFQPPALAAAARAIIDAGAGIPPGDAGPDTRARGVSVEPNVEPAAGAQ
jgi:hypothetical protein